MHSAEAGLIRTRGGADHIDIEEAVRSALRDVYFNLNGEKVADLTSYRTESNISARERARTRSMGG